MEKKAAVINLTHITGAGKVKDEKKNGKESPKRDDSSVSISKAEMKIIEENPGLRMGILMDKRKSEIASREMVQ